MTDEPKPVTQWSDEELVDHAQMLRESIRHKQERLDTILDLLAAQKRGGSE